MIYESTTLKTRTITMDDGSKLVTQTRTEVTLDGLRTSVYRSRIRTVDVAELPDFEDNYRDRL